MLASHKYSKSVFGLILFLVTVIPAALNAQAFDYTDFYSASLISRTPAEATISEFGLIQAKPVLAKAAGNAPTDAEEFRRLERRNADASVDNIWVDNSNTIAFSNFDRLTAAGGAVASQFGTSVALDGDTLIVGAPFERNESDFADGAAYIFVRGTDGWTRQAKLTTSDAPRNRNFGTSVAISGNTVVVGARFDEPKSINAQGSAYIFVRNGSSWTLQQKLVAADGMNGSQFGASVAIDKDTVAVGASSDRIDGAFQGSAYIFNRVGDAWFQQAKLIDTLGVDSAQFGISIDVNGDTAIVGARYGNVGGGRQGVACVFVRNGNAWSQQARLAASNVFNPQQFGISVALAGNTAVIGASATLSASGLEGGSAYIFVRNETTWTQRQQILAADSLSGRFGISVDIAGEKIVVGANLDLTSSNPNYGAAYIFIKQDDNWIQQAKLLAPDAAPGDFLGTAVAVSGNKFIVGAPGVDIGSNGNQGAAYYFIQPTSAPDLQPGSDTGSSSTDNITTSHNLFINVGGVTNGATVELLRNGTVINSAAVSGSMVMFNDNNVTEGAFEYSTRQTVNGEVSSRSEATLVIIDNTAPSVTINQANGQIDPTPEQSVRFAAVFSEPVVGFDASDVSFAASTAIVSGPNFVVMQNPTTFLISANNIVSDAQQIVRADILAGVVQDLAGNANVASTSTDNTIAVDNVRPTVTVNQAINQSDPTANQPVNFTVVFSEPVGGFDASDILFTGSTANVSQAFIAVTGGNKTYNVAITGVTSNGGILRVSVRPEAALDAGSNSSVASTGTDNAVTIDNVSPAVTINQAVGQSDPTNALPVNFTVVFSESVTGFDASDISLSNSSINASGAGIIITGSGSTYNVAVSNITSNGGIVRAVIRSGAAFDSLNNPNLASTSRDNAVTVDNVAPAVSVNRSAGQSDPASTQPVNFTVVFTENVSGFDASDISLTGSTANVSGAIVTVTGVGSIYNLKISNIASSGQLQVAVVAGAARDAVGNLSAVSTNTDNSVVIILRSVSFDFDGDGKSDVSVYRPSNGVWYLLNSTAGFSAVQFGISTDKIVPADYDGDGKTDFAVYRGGIWYLQRSGQGFAAIQFGSPGDIPTPADFDGDGRADLAVYRPLNGTWYTLNLVNNAFGAVQFGISEDKPVAADYDGDGRADYAVYRSSTGVWYLLQSGKGFTAIQFGVSTDKPVVGDYDGDGKTDIAVYRPETGTWYLLQSTKGFASLQFGLSTDLPAPADYDGDGKTDVAVFRPETGNWYQMKSTQDFGAVQFGTSGDKPTPAAFVP